MKTSGLFTVHAHKINAQYGKPFRLVFFGDVHRDSPNHADGAWQDFLRYARGLKDAYFFGMGDYVDSASTSERACLSRADLHESTAGHLLDIAAAKVSLLAKELSFMRGPRLVGMLNGNHFFNFPDGTNTDQKLCGLLGCKYLGVSSFVRLSIDFSGAHTSLDIWAHHGSGAGRLVGGSINRVDQMREHAEADIYCMGHDHKRGVWPATPRLYLDTAKRVPDSLRLRQRQQWLIRSGSFLKSYDDGEVNYNVDAGRGPCSLGHVELIVTPTRTKDGTHLEIHGLT